MPFSEYSDTYDAKGDLAVFFTNSSYKDGKVANGLLDDSSKHKIGGRYVQDKDGRRVKLYNSHLLLAMGVSNVSIIKVEGKPFTQVKGAKFGIHAVTSTVDTEQEDANGKPYKRIDHYLQAKSTDAKPEAKTV